MLRCLSVGKNTNKPANKQAKNKLMLCNALIRSALGLHERGGEGVGGGGGMGLRFRISVGIGFQNLQNFSVAKVLMSSYILRKY